MAGSIKWFVYTDDLGEDWGIKRDESNTEAVNAGAQDYAQGVTIPNAVPRNVKPRVVVYSNPERTITRTIVALTPTIYSGVLNGGVPTITDQVSGQVLGLVGAKGEQRTLPRPLDTGRDDGDDT